MFIPLSFIFSGSLTLTYENPNPMLDMANVAYTGENHHVCTLQISNDNANGFRLKAKSQSAAYSSPATSQMVRMLITDPTTPARNYNTTLYAGDYNFYRMRFKTPESGSHYDTNVTFYTDPIPTIYGDSAWGTESYSTAFDTSYLADTFYLEFNQTASPNITSNITMKFFVETLANDRLFEGPFTDTITFTLSDL